MVDVRPLDVPALYLVAALLLSVAAVCLTTGSSDRIRPRRSPRRVCSVFLTLPVVFARRAPVAAAMIILVAAAGNVLIAGRIVRCGVALPAAFWIAFMIGYSLARPRAVAGLALVFAALAVHGWTDPASIRGS